MLILSLGGPPFIHALGIEQSLADGASRVLHVFAWSLPAYLVATVCIYFLEALERPLPGMVFMWVANGVNLVVNLWLVPGHSGFPIEGAEASAWSTFVARTALVLGLLIFIARMPEAKALGVFRKPVDGPAAAREQRKIGYGSGASMFIEVGAFAAMTLIAGRIGGLEAAAWSVVLNVAAIIFMGPLGLSSATAVLVGRAYGAKDSEGVVRSGLLGFGVTAVLSLIIVAVIWPGAGLIGGSYSSDPGLLALAIPALVLSCLFYTTDGLQVVAAQALRARGDVWLPTGFHLASYGAVMLPLGWVFAEHLKLGVNGLVWAVIVASAVSCAFLVGRFLYLARRAV
jgi:MATE family multidrug resistance protein